MAASETHRTIDAVWRIESPRLIAGLARYVRDVGLAEELAHDALVVALERWPEAGVPANPGAWLMAAAKNRAIDRARHARLLERKQAELGHEIEARHEAAALDLDAAIDDDVGDDLLRLMLIACHPVLPTEARVALTLRLLRLASVLEVVYLVFNEGYSATAGDDWVRPGLCEDALRLGRVLAELVPRVAEAHGLVALMEIQASRLRARVGPTGEPILLLNQNRAHWDHLLIRRGLAALERAEQLGGAQGPYALQAAIAACHARARTPAQTDWARIATLYAALARATPSPVVELNRAVALAMAFGPAAGLALVDEIAAEPSLQGYYLLPAVRGDLLARLARHDEARAEFERAAALTRNTRERTLLLARAAACPPGSA
ncbi:MAG: RNA polymerase subunit sigma-24 [Polyangiaceae bacterium]|nr:RNA polymerase subunit sigma-24 [Polyangiaceae bacterium]